MNRIRFRRALGAILLCCMLTAIAGCTSDSNKSLEFSPDALLKGTDIGADNLSGTRIIGDIALVTTNHFSGGTLAAIDLPSGKTLWSADDGDPILGGEGAHVDLSSPHEALPPTARDLGKGKFDVLVPYRKARGSADSTEDATSPSDSGSTPPFDRGIAAVSGEDGHAVWTSEAFEKASNGTDKGMARPVLAGDDTVVAASGKRKGGHITGWILDAETGKTRSKTDNLWPVAHDTNADSSGIVIVEPARKPDLLWSAHGPDRIDKTAPRGIDPDSGDAVWDLDDRFDHASITAAAGNFAVVSGTLSSADSDGSAHSTELIDISDGSVVEELEDFAECRSSAVLIACNEDDELTTVSGADAAIERSSPYDGDAARSWKSARVFGATIITEDTTQDGDGFKAVDREGETRIDDLDSVPAAMTDDYLVTCAEAAAKCTIHAADSDATSDLPTAANTPALKWGAALPSSHSAEADPDEIDIKGGGEHTAATGVAVADEHVLVNGDTEDGSAVTSLEADSGNAAWTIDRTTDLRTEAGAAIDVEFSRFGDPDVVETKDGAKLVIPAVSGGRSGIAAIDVVTGEPDSFHPLADSEATVRVATTRSHLAAVTVKASTEARTTMLTDFSIATKPKTVWKDKGTEAKRITAESVVVQKQVDEGRTAERTDVRVLGLGKDKEELWSSRDSRADEVPGSVTAADGLVFIRWEDGAEIIDAADGSSLASIGKRLSDCVGAAGPVMCSSVPDTATSRPGFPIVVNSTDSGVEVTELRSRTVAGVSGSAAGNFFVEQPNGALSIDSAGVVIDDDPPGDLHSVSKDGVALFRTSLSQDWYRPAWEIRRLK